MPDTETKEVTTVEPTPSIGPLTLTFNGVYEIDTEELEERTNKIVENDRFVLELADIESVKVYARVCIILERLDAIIKGPMFVLNHHGLPVPHPIHLIYERERKFFERMSMRLGQNPAARKAIIGMKVVPPEQNNQSEDERRSIAKVRSIEDVSRGMMNL